MKTYLVVEGPDVGGLGLAADVDVVEVLLTCLDHDVLHVGAVDARLAWRGRI